MFNRLFIDDERFPCQDDWAIVRSSNEAIEWVTLHGMPEEISFDHDLGEDDTSRVFIHWMIEQMIDGLLHFPSDFKYSVHSQNPIGAEWIMGTMDLLIRCYHTFPQYD